jgi:hypothetical protein
MAYFIPYFFKKKCENILDMTLRGLRKMIVASGLAVATAGPAAVPSDAAVRPVFTLSSAGGSVPGRPGTSSVAVSKDEPRGAPAVPGMPKKGRRAVLEMGIVAVCVTAGYWSQYHDWVEDWQFELTWADQARRFLTTEAITFDSNAYSVNWAHVPSGAGYYQMARTNYLSWRQSILAAFVNSLVYEYVSEWREVVSINDTILATFGGYALGESWFQLSDHFHHQKSLGFRVLAFMNPINELNQYLDRHAPASRAYAEPGWAGLAFSAGWLRSSETGRGVYDALRIGLETQIIRSPEYGLPGTVNKVLRDTSFSELAIDVVLRPHRPGDVYLANGPFEEVDLFARTVGLASYSQKIDATGRGHAFSIGLGSALTYLRKRPAVYDSRDVRANIDPLPAAPTDFRDKMTVAHMAGPVVDWTRFGRGFKIRAVAAAYFDFGLMNAFAFNAYSGVYPIQGMKTTLGYYGYYYAYGVTTSGRLDVDWGRLWVRVLASGHAWGSWNVRDQFQAELTNNSAASDTRSRFLFKGGWRFPRAPVRAFASVESIRRWGRMGNIEAGSRETRASAGLSYLF